MEYSRSESSAVAVTMTLLALLLIGVVGLVVLAGGFFFLRASSARNEALVQRELAMLNQKEAETALRAQQALERQLAAELSSSTVEPATSVEPTGITPDLVLSLSDAGELLLDGEEISVDDLRTHADGSNSGSIQLVVDAFCPSSRLIEIVNECQARGLVDIELAVAP